ncbi:siderophore-interacting protein [Vibrio hibernica]|uniref:siderophore-interacting protein n=1 Tax=Vibrio hibernica TaxID=2587465 RepID=UPI001881FDB5|nr:siderophore-interacting protein [Vibrio hibernica]
MMPKRPLKTTTVIDSFSLTPNMQRIVLQGEELKQLQTPDLGGYIKLIFHPEGHTDVSNLADGERRIMRTYTISELDVAHGKISIDFVKHEAEHTDENRNIRVQDQGGYAIRWAMKAKVGDHISIGGPGNSQDIDFNAEQLFLVADMTAIPALSAKITALKPDAVGDVIVQLTSEQDLPNWTLPQGMTLHKVVGYEPSQLSDYVINIAAKSLDIAIWCACEFTAMKTIRGHFNDHNLVQRHKSYFSSYWKQGVTEDGHKLIKRKDAEGLTTLL